LIESLSFALSITGPIFIIITLGCWLKRIGLISYEFINTASSLVFKVCLPTLLFLSIQNAAMPTEESVPTIVIAFLSTLVLFFTSWLISPLIVAEPRDRGVFVQGSFRSNLGVIGLAFSAKAYGDEGLALASMMMAFVTILYNILSVTTLTSTLQPGREHRLRPIFVGIFTNPLIIAIVLSFTLKLLDIGLPAVLQDTGEYFASMTLPLALLCIGATFSFQSLRRASKIAAWASLMKLLVMPLLCLAIATAFGVRGMPLGVLFLMVSAPTAAASYVMVEAMKGNSELAANIVAMSTLWSIFTVSTGLFFLKSLELI